jgi:hypothetical protein
VSYLSTVNIKSYLPEKLILFRIFWDIFSSQIYQPLCPLFMNGKCEKLSTRKVNFIYNILGIFLTLKNLLGPLPIIY